MFDKLINSIRVKSENAQAAPFIIAISGFCGSGKSTLANKLKENLSDAEIVCTDLFLNDRLMHRSEDWSCFDHKRLVEEVLVPARQGEYVTYGIYDWKKNMIEEKVTLPKVRFLIVEGCSIFHPDLRNYYDYKVWVDTPLEEAMRRGIARDRLRGFDADWDEKWETVWTPNDRDFFKKYKPRQVADLVYRAHDP